MSYLTDGEPLPAPCEASGDPGARTALLKTAILEQGIAVEYVDELGGALGTSSGGCIRLLNGLSPAMEFDLAAERGPALTDARHRFTSLANFPLVKKFSLGTVVRVQSGLPYNITTGFDNNGDTVSNDRPAGVTRNSARGSAIVDVGARLTYSIGFGGPARPVGGPQVAIIRGSDADPLRSMPSGDGNSARYRLELYAQGYNLTNHTNALNFSGVMTSPFFGQATSALPARRLELGARVVF